MRARLGQNFLIDKNIARKIVLSAEISPLDTVIEIGPGRGILTEELSKFSKKIIAVEIDKTLADYLSGRLDSSPDLNGVKIINANFLKWELPAASGKKLKFVANLPYYISSAVIEKILSADNWSTAVFTVQKEVADRINSAPGCKDYGVLSVACQLFCKAEKLFDIPPDCFRPVPKVTSSVIRLVRIQKRLVKKCNEKKFFKIVKASFAHRRKTILNSLYMEFNIDPVRDTVSRCDISNRVEKKVLQKKLLAAGIPPTVRAETVSVSNFIKLTMQEF